MITRIKRLAQFLFDNADVVEQFLCEADSYRSMDVSLNLFKHDLPELQLGVSLYDARATHYYLRDNAIIREKFVQLCNTINEDTGVTELPEPVEVRDKLEGDKNGSEEKE